MSKAKLIIRSDGQPDQEFAISGITSIGRAFDNLICLYSPGMSRYHAIIEQRPDGYWLSDLKSRNGTLVNGEAVASERKLEDGDSVSMGQASTLEFRLCELHADHPNASANAPPRANGDEAAPSNQPSPRQVSAANPATGSAGSASSSAKTGIAIVSAIALVLGIALLVVIFQFGAGKTAGRNENQPTRLDEKQVRATESDSNKAITELPSPVPVDNGSQPALPEAGRPVGTPGLLEITAMAEKLAAAIGGKTDFIIAPEFAAQIQRRTSEYRVDVIGDARRYSREIRRAFGTDKGLSPIIGLVLAMSRSKFRADASGAGVGIWQIPPKSIPENNPNQPPSVVNEAERAAEVAATYTKSLMSQFTAEEFMYAIACFSKPNQVGDLLRTLAQQEPNDRRDFWKMVELRVVSVEDADQVVRFFAAGIVGYNPQRFGLNAKSLESLSF